MAEAVRMVSSKRTFTGRHVVVRDDRVRFPDGTTVMREIMGLPDSVCVVPLDAQGDVLSVRQYRGPAEGELLEVPAGAMEGGEALLACAASSCRTARPGCRD